MKKLVFGFLVGLLLGVGGSWYYNQASTQEKEELKNAAKNKVLESAEKVKTVIQEKIGEIRAEDIKQELNRTGMVVREKARQAGEALADATADARITAAVKAKMGMSAVNTIHVTTTDGLVTLSGVVSSHEEVAKAVRLALDTEGVHKVISTLQVKPAS